MPPLTLVPGPVIEGWQDPEVRAYLLDAYRRRVPPWTSLAMEAHQPDILRAFARFWWATLHRGVVDPTLKEELRVAIAAVHDCSYCATSSGAVPSDTGRRSGAADEASAAMAFAMTLAERPWELGSGTWYLLETWFDAPARTELVLFCAWQVGGPRVLRSWGASTYQTLRDATHDELPDELPYKREAGASPNWPATPSSGSAEARERAARLGSPPVAWLDWLAPRPDLRDAWLDLYLATVHGRTLPARIGQLIRLELARFLNCPAWAPRHSPALVEAGIVDVAPVALAQLDGSSLDLAECLALLYTRSIVTGERLQPDVEAAIGETFSEAQRVELGFAVASQLGPVLVLRSLGPAAASPIQLAATPVEGGGWP